jgi:hypothetical protein
VGMWYFRSSLWACGTTGAACGHVVLQVQLVGMWYYRCSLWACGTTGAACGHVVLQVQLLKDMYSESQLCWETSSVIKNMGCNKHRSALH